MNNITLFFNHEWMAVHKWLLQVFHTNDEILKYVGFAWLGVVLLGIILGSKKVVAVYNDFDDVGQVFITILMPIVCWFLFTIMAPKTNTTVFSVVKWVGIVMESIMILSLFFNTWKRNKSIVKTLIAFTTKMTLASLLVLNILMIFMGSTRKKNEMQQQGALVETGLLQSLVMTGLVAALIFYLIDDKGLGLVDEINQRYMRKAA